MSPTCHYQSEIFLLFSAVQLDYSASGQRRNCCQLSDCPGPCPSCMGCCFSRKQWGVRGDRKSATARDPTCLAFPFGPERLFFWVFVGSIEETLEDPADTAADMWFVVSPRSAVLLGGLGSFPGFILACWISIFGNTGSALTMLPS